MQKKLIALAVAGLASTAAFAQSNVTVYGVADVGYARLSGLSNTKAISSIESGLLGGSRIGFKGTEDLGNGLKALFTFEYALALDENTGVGAADSLGTTGVGTMSGSVARQQFVGLNGNFGTVLAGRLQTAGFDWAAATNPLAGGALDTVGKLKAAQLLAAGNSGRADNAVAYVSPNFSGLTLAVNHARLTEANGVTNKSENYANLLAANYVNGPMALNAVYAKISNPGTVASDDQTEYGLGGSYDFKVAKLFASYQQKKTKPASGTDKKYSIAAVVPVTAAGAVVASYAKNTLNNNAVKDDSSNSWTVAYLHSLSKRTTLYAGYNVTNNDKNAVAGLGTSYVPTAGTGDNVKVLGLGVNHKF